MERRIPWTGKHARPLKEPKKALEEGQGRRGGCHIKSRAETSRADCGHMKSVRKEQVLRSDLATNKGGEKSAGKCRKERILRGVQ